MCTDGGRFDDENEQSATPAPPAQEPLWLAVAKWPWRYAVARIRGTVGKP